MKGLFYHASRLTLLALYRGFLDFEVRGSQHVPKRGGAVLAANHASFLDPPALGLVLSRHVSFVARGTLADSKALAIFFWGCDVIRIRRGEPDSHAIRLVMRCLAEGRLVGLFPEGTRSASGALGPFEEGAVLMARRAKVPVVPLAIAGTFEAMPKGKGVRRHPVRVVYGEPFDASLGTRTEATAELRERIGVLLEEARAWNSSK